MMISRQKKGLRGEILRVAIVSAAVAFSQFHSGCSEHAGVGSSKNLDAGKVNRQEYTAADARARIAETSIATQRIFSREDQTILNYTSMREVKQLLEQHTQVRDALIDLLEVYDARLEYRELRRRIDGVLGARPFPADQFTQNGTEAHFQITKAWIVNLAHGLWVEKNGLVSWSLENYTQAQIRFLFPTTDRSENQYPIAILSRNNFSYEDNDPHKLFRIGWAIRETSAIATAEKTVEWVSRNFFHVYRDGNEDFEYRTLYPNGIPRIEELFRERAIFGCWDSSSLSATVLRSVNIPAISVQSNYIHPNNGGAYSGMDEYHGGLMIPHIDRYANGDWLFSAGQRGNLILYPHAEFVRYIPYVRDEAMRVGGDPGPRFYNPNPDNFGVTIRRRATSSSLYIDGLFVLDEERRRMAGSNAPYVVTNQAFDNRDIRQPRPNFSLMIRDIGEFDPQVRVDRTFPYMATVSGTSVRIKTLEQILDQTPIRF
ncbi:hypothetical protein HY990_04285 [Candidatus Micrarchaeota archaeon]|nr:hypothetical protein [Candidatus Micrarchaeota archaeon]